MDVFDKLRILSAAAKYDVACTSSGVDRTAPKDGIGSAASCGICHSFAADGRCISLLKILMTNACAYDCKYCANRSGADIERAAFTPKEIADLTINFYRRNYIEGLFLSSAVAGTPDRTMEMITEAVRLLREEHRFYGYIHAKVIPGADPEAIDRLGLLVDRLSVNIEFPSSESLQKFAPCKSKESVLQPMGYVSQRILDGRALPSSSKALLNNPNSTAAVSLAHGSPITAYKGRHKFAPAGQSTQMIIGASPESDLSILKLTQGLYKKYGLKRVFFSAYVPIVDDSLLPAIGTKPPLLRENRLYQADWLMRFYGFEAGEILDEGNPTFNPYLDPKCNWAVNHPEFFPVEINKSPLDRLLRVPGIGVLSAKKIVRARRAGSLSFEDLRKIGVVLKRAKYFITCSGHAADGIRLSPESVLSSLLSKAAAERLSDAGFARQISMFEDKVAIEEEIKVLTGQL